MLLPESILCQVLWSYFVDIVDEDLLGCLWLNVRLIRHQLHCIHMRTQFIAMLHTRIDTNVPWQTTCSKPPCQTGMLVSPLNFPIPATIIQLTVETPNMRQRKSARWEKSPDFKKYDQHQNNRNNSSWGLQRRGTPSLLMMHCNKVSQF